jgi:hypothetical protein
MKYRSPSSALSQFLPFFTLALLFIGLLQPAAEASPIIWTGPTTTFTKAAAGDPMLPENQDRLTSLVWITRAGTQGIYNAKTETLYAHNFSPADTEWAYGVLADYATLSYTSWEGLYSGNIGGGPPSTLNKDIVVHLKSDDIYLSLKFTAWAAGSLGGGGFSYIRSTPGSVQTPPPSPKIGNPVVLGNGSVRFSFTNSPGFTFTVLGSTNVALPLASWTVLGSITNSPAGFYQFTDTTAPANARRFYVVHWP